MYCVDIRTNRANRWSNIYLLEIPTLLTNRLGFAFHVDELFSRELQIYFR